MHSVIINGKKHFNPTRYEELSHRQYCDLIGTRIDKDYDKMISIMTGLSIEEVRGAEIEGLEILIRDFDFLKKPMLIEEKPIKLGSYTFPDDIRYQTVEQYQDTLAEIKRIQELGDEAEANRSFALYAAIYCQRDFNGKYDSDRAKALAESFMSYPCLEVVAAGSFFMARSQSLQNGLSMSFLRQNILLKKRLPVLRQFLRRLGFILHLIPSRGM